MSKNLSAKYYQENKNNNMVMNDTKIYQKMKKKSLLSLEKNIIE